jgi:hypothetical protein
MPIEYPYVVTIDKFKEFMSGLHQKGVPTRADRVWLKSLGYGSSNHAAFLSVLKFVGLLDAGGRPTADYAPVIRGGNRARFAGLLRASYAPLFSVYPDAHRKDKEALRTFFRANTSSGEQVVTATTNVFQTLCGLADFEAEPEPVSAGAAHAIEEASRGAREQPSVTTVQRATGTPGLTININLQIELPATTEADVYDKLFAAMARHLMKLGEE